MRIHYFVSSVHEQGTYFRFHNLAIGLLKLGHEVTVFGCDVALGSQQRTEIRDGVRYVIVPEAPFASWFFANHPLTALRRALRAYPPCDIAHLFQPFLGAAAGWRRCPARLRFYDWDDQWTGGLFGSSVGSRRERWTRFVVRHLEDRLPSRADHVTAVSEYLADFARQRNASAVSLVYNGFWPGEPAEKKSARKGLGLRPDALYVGFMGRTTAEIDWCFSGIAECANDFPNLRMAICGAPASVLELASGPVRERVDYLGQIPTASTRDLAAAIDLGLLPLEVNPFNLSRFPIKFSEHLASGNPLLFSEVGECGRLGRRFPWAFPAGTGKTDWLRSFRDAIGRLARGDRPSADQDRLAEELSWPALAHRLLGLYQGELEKCQAKPNAKNAHRSMAPVA